MTGQTLTHEQSTLLLGAMAVDAVDPDEFVALEEHLARCPSCRAEVRAHHETLSAMVGASIPPLDLRARVLAAGPARVQVDASLPPLVLERATSRTDTVPPLGDRPTRLDEGRERRAGNAVKIALAAAASLVLVVAASAVVLRSRDRPIAIDEVAARARDDGQHRSVVLRSTAGGAGATAVVATDGTGYLFSGDLPALPAGRTYQLWALGGADGTTPVSVGLLGRDPDVSTFRADTRVTGFAVSEESDGGAVTPSAPLAVGTF